MYVLKDSINLYEEIILVDPVESASTLLNMLLLQKIHASYAQANLRLMRGVNPYISASVKLDLMVRTEEHAMFVLLVSPFLDRAQ